MESTIRHQKEVMDILVEENTVLKAQIATLTAQVIRLEKVIGEAVRAKYVPSPMA